MTFAKIETLLETKINDRDYAIIIDYYMAFFILHVISSRDLHISPRAEGPRANIGRVLIWHVICKMPYHNIFIIYRLWTKVFVGFQYSLYISYCKKNYSEVNSCSILIIYVSIKT